MCGKELMVYSKRLQSILERECFTHLGGGLGVPMYKTILIWQYQSRN